MRTVFFLVIALCAAFVSAQSVLGNGTVIGKHTCISLEPSTSCFIAEYEKSQEGEYCGFCFTDDGENIVFYCDGDTSCQFDSTADLPLCRPFTVKKIGEECNPESDDEVCVDGDYEVACITNGVGRNVCGGDDVYGPGDECGTNNQDATILRDGNACYRSDCGSDNKCTSAALGESCEELYCVAGLYCNENEVCVARLADGAACTLLDTNGHDETRGGNSGCAANSDCINDVCVGLYTVADTGSCGDGDYYNSDVCAEDYTCDRRGSEPYKCIKLTDGNPCDLNNDNCGNYFDCECSYATGTGVCIGEQNRIGDELRAALQCLVDNDCYQQLDYFTEGCVKEACGTRITSVISASAEAESDRNALLGIRSSAASALVATLLAVGVAVALVL